MDNKEISYRKQRPDLFFRDGRPKKRAMLCEKESYQRETKLINGPSMFSGWTCGGNRFPLYGHCDK